jgi:hypothetical protein
MIEFLKPNIKKSKHEIDLYGFSDIIEEITNIKRPLKPMATWVHGWNYQPLSSPRVLSAYGEYLDYRRIVRSIGEKNILEEYGFTNIQVGGLPFQYVNPSNIAREPGSLIVMGEHSLTIDKKDSINRWNGLIDEVDKNYKNDFNIIKICMTGEDYNSNIIRKMIENRGYEVIIGGYKNDRNSLKRLREIFDYFDYGITTCLGSHLVYAHYSGCKMGIVKKYFGLSILHSNEYGKSYNGLKYINDEDIYNKYVFSNYAEKYYDFLFIENQLDLLNLKNFYDWAHKEIGGNNKFETEQIINALAWSKTEYLLATTRYLRDKILDRRSI